MLKITHYKLIEAIKSLSVANNYYDAIKEWKLEIIIDSFEPTTCLCGHYPIKELCIIQNTKNKEKTIVGNCCILKILNIDTEKLFKGLKKIKKDNSKSINKEFLNYVFEHNIINDWEFDFYDNIKLKRKLTLKQLECKSKINEKILIYFQNNGQKPRQ